MIRRLFSDACNTGAHDAPARKLARLKEMGEIVLRETASDVMEYRVFSTVVKTHKLHGGLGMRTCVCAVGSQALQIYEGPESNEGGGANLK